MKPSFVDYETWDDDGGIKDHGHYIQHSTEQQEVTITEEYKLFGITFFTKTTTQE